MAPSKHRHIHYTASTILKSTDSDLNQTNSANAMRLETLDLSGISTEYLEFTRLSSLGCCNYHVCPAPTSPPIPGRVFRRGWSAFTTMPMFGLKSASYCTHKAATAANCINTHTNHHSIHQLYPTFSSDPLPIVFLCWNYNPLEIHTIKILPSARITGSEPITSSPLAQY